MNYRAASALWSRPFAFVNRRFTAATQSVSYRKFENLRDLLRKYRVEQSQDLRGPKLSTAVASILSTTRGGLPAELVGAACRTLCELGGLPSELWTAAGPSELAWKYRYRRRWQFDSEAAWTIFRLAWDLWTFSGDEPRHGAPLVSVDELLRLDPKTVLIVAGLLLAWAKSREQLAELGKRGGR